ncbi:oxidoreductase [Nocardia higoensis]|uniref:oxidoreductase n=1 Tax=Nocardia higoensis TaxID=228599 RepID=UPI0002D2F131|nr:FAD-dependent oxidoreductase [Nocardia higoensis]
MSSHLSTGQKIGRLQLRNRLVATAHGSGAVTDGLAQPGDDDYWRRCAAGGAAMVIAGGTVVSPESANRVGNITEAWRPEGIDGLRRRAAAITGEGAIACCQLVHLGRETLGAELWEHPVAPSAVRSPREPVTARELTDAEVQRIIDDFTLSARHATDAGFAAVELHAAHGYLIAQFLSPATNHRPGAETVEGRASLLHRLHTAITAACPGLALGVRVSLEGAVEAGLDLDGLAELLPLLDRFDYINVTAGVRTTYVRDMATATPPLLSALPVLRAATTRPLLVSQAFRTRAEIDAALAAGADLVGMARPFIADPDIADKLLRGDDHRIRPCVSCNEDCRSFTPVLLCSVNPDLAPPGETARPARPLRLGPPPASTRRIAVVGAGPAGLEAAHRLGAARSEVTLFEAAPEIGGQLRVAAAAPNRTGWARLLEFYRHNLDGVTLELGHRVTAADLRDFSDVVLAVGAAESTSPGADSATETIARPQRVRPGEHVVVVDDGFGWWLGVSAVEAALAARAGRVTILVPGPAVAAGIPPESRVQLRGRWAGEPVHPLVESACAAIDTTEAGTAVTVRNVLSHEETRLSCDRVVRVGERRSADWREFTAALPSTRFHVAGDALVPRRVAHAVSEGRAAAAEILGMISVPNVLN